MAVAEQDKFFVNLVGGLNTDATDLTFPDNAAVDLDNIDIFRTGEVKRRLGVEFETNYILSNEDFDQGALDGNAISMHEWKAVNGKGDLNFLAVQVGSQVIFHELGFEPLSDTPLGQISIEPFVQGNGVPGDSLLDSSYGEGIMILTNPNMNPIRVSFDEDTETFTATAIQIEIRDFEGLDDGLEVDERPSQLTNEHKYNLRNQGWPLTATVNLRRDGGRSVATGVDPIEATNRLAVEFEVFGTTIPGEIGIGAYPSNADIIHIAKAQAASDAEVIGSYSPFHLDDALFGNSPAPKGHFIFSIFDQNRSSVSGITGLGGATIAERPSVTAFYAGRVWFSGVPNVDLAGDVFFSQNITDPDNAGKCYQDQDPTAQDFNSLLATDGGVIHLADMGQVYRMVTVGQDLMIIAANGIWAISGPEGANFTADGFTVRKVTDLGTLSANSVLEADNRLYYWNKGGIYVIASGQISNILDISRVSQDKIQNFFDDISEAARAYARGWYDPFESRIYWFYNDTEAYDAISFRFSYNRVLVYDLTLDAFYTYTISDLPTNSPFVAGMTQKEAGSEAVVTYNVVQGLGSSKDNVVQGGDNVVEDIAFPSFTNVQLKLLTFVVASDSNFEYTFAEFKDTGFNDWTIWDKVINNPNNTGADYDSFLQMGWQMYGDPIRVKKITSLSSYFNRTETGYSLVDGEIVFDNPSSCFIQTRWEWTGQDVGRWTKLEQAYRLLPTYIPEDENDPFDYGFEVVQTKLRMRGKGHSFSVRYESEAGKDFQLIGFGVNVRAGSKV